MAATLITSLGSPLSSPRHSPLSRNPHKIKFRSSYSSSTLVRCSIATISPSKIDGDTSNGYSVDCVVVGGGISGLCVAHALETKHRDVVGKVMVTEARDRVGGNIITVERDGFLWEEGSNSFQPSNSMLTLAVDNGLKDDLVLGNPDAPRFVF